MAFERDPKKLFPHDYLLKHTVVPLVPAFVSPNMVTVFRLVCTPIALWLLSIENYAAGVPFFIFLAFTDALDGTLARLRHQITQWGTFYDPVADKLLIGSVVLLVVSKHVGIFFGLTIIAIELAIIVGAHRRRKKGRLHGANIFGKTKMVLQVAGIALLLISLWTGFEFMVPYSVGTLSLAIVFAVISLFTYGL